MLRRATVVLALVSALLPAAIGADRTLQDQLTDQYSQKILFLRHSFTSDAQEYNAEGNLKSKRQEGPWTFYGRIFVDKVVLEENNLRLEGERVAYKLDEDATRLIPVRQHQRLKITVRLNSPLTSLDQAAAVLGRIFFVTEQEMLNAAPPDWRPYLARQTGAQDAQGHGSQDNGDAGASPGTEKIFKMGEPRVTPPKPLLAPAPQFSETAIRGGFEGVVGLNVIVDSKGRISKVIVVHPAGRGLDEEAVRTVKSWRFKPATRDGQPVAVAVYIEIDFHLYDR